MALVKLLNDKVFDAPANISILDAARAAGLVLEHGCKTGRCGSCKAVVTFGETQAIGDVSGLSDAERNAGYVLTCTTAAVGNIHLDIEDISLLADFPTRTTPCRIDAIEKLTQDVVRVVMRFPPKAAPSYLPGQYVDVVGPRGIRRSYSIANEPAVDAKVELQVRLVQGGQMSDYWFDKAKTGDLLRLEGPKGSFFLRDVSDLHLVFLATGTGIAPVKAMLEGLARRVAPGLPRSITVLWGGRVESDIYWRPQVRGLETLEFIPVLSRAGPDWAGARGHIQDVLLSRKPDLANTVVYACGSQAMIDSASTELVVGGLSPKRFYSDAFVSSSI